MFGHLKNMFLKQPCYLKEIIMEIRKYFELNDDKNTIYQKLWGIAKTRRKFILLHANIRKENRLIMS